MQYRLDPRRGRWLTLASMASRSFIGLTSPRSNGPRVSRMLRVSNAGKAQNTAARPASLGWGLTDGCAPVGRSLRTHTPLSPRGMLLAKQTVHWRPPGTGTRLTHRPSQSLSQIDEGSLVATDGRFPGADGGSKDRRRSCEGRASRQTPRPVRAWGNCPTVSPVHRHRLLSTRVL